MTTGLSSPRLAEVWANKGVTLGELGRYQEAIACLKKFIDFAPPQYTSLARKAEEYMRQVEKRYKITIT